MTTAVSRRKPAQVEAVERVEAEVVEAGPMTEDEARTLTDRIKAHLWDTGKLVEEGINRQAWKALGYRTWVEWVEDEIGITRREALLLLARERCARWLIDLLGGSVPALTIRQAQVINRDAERIAERVHAGEDARDVVADYLATTRKSVKHVSPTDMSEDDDPELDRRQAANHRRTVTMEVTFYYPAPSEQPRTRYGLPDMRESEPEVWSHDFDLGIAPPATSAHLAAWCAEVANRLYREVMADPFRGMRIVSELAR